LKQGKIGTKKKFQIQARNWWNWRTKKGTFYRTGISNRAWWLIYVFLLAHFKIVIIMFDTKI
jgi:hypothetical protein